MHTKLHINISQGIVDVEGDADLVREIYADFKDKLLNGLEISRQATPHQNPSEEPSDDALPQKNLSDAPLQEKRLSRRAVKAV